MPTKLNTDEIEITTLSFGSDEPLAPRCAADVTDLCGLRSHDLADERRVVLTYFDSPNPDLGRLVVITDKNNKGNIVRLVFAIDLKESSKYPDQVFTCSAEKVVTRAQMMGMTTEQLYDLVYRFVN